MRSHPHLYEINTRIFLRRLSDKYGRRLTLATVPDAQWRDLARRGFDLVWLMGVWQRSPGSRRLAATYEGLRHEYDQALPDWTEEDVAGSPYAIRSYTIDPALGRADALAKLRTRLHRHGLRLMVDFVPNHLALDHPWTESHPGRFVAGAKADVAAHPDWFFSRDGKKYLAHGRDPYFSPWGDTVQVNFFSPDMRQALIDELLRIAEAADGVRCDMAMLALNDVFEQVWGPVLKRHPPIETEFWAEAISAVKQRHPGFIFLAEAYWGLEQRLQQLGFDFTYDKVLYDKLRYCPPQDISSHLESQTIDHSRLARFIENHDEARSYAAFGRQRYQAAAVVMSTIPGLRFFHDGQLEGKRIRLPVQLVREPREEVDSDVAGFYDRLLAICNAPAFHDGRWSLLDMGQAWPGNDSHHCMLAWCWQHLRQVKIVVVNFAPHPSQGRLRLPQSIGGETTVELHDELSGETFVRDRGELRNEGLYVALGPWNVHILDTTAR